ncbi:RDD family protein [Anaerobacillus isosaccharinicus]|uniref:RDD family protein n=1 Tax=Anaerobacillus isosaccharinicus TaxID=1532552 RepID=A0A1S2KTR5_9BACI|nr:RDD family protein [Anaerobacillus isosaccharinicus]MBA5588040.1 RDD family protein [Anaerobacillus isosaccharinicus]QOY33820.1 RDD family protein [Anaerobacillus isosaccharinicus]
MALNEEWIQKLTAVHYRAGIGSRILGFIYDLITMFFLWVIVGIFTTLWMLVTSNAPGDDFIFIRTYILENEPHLFYTAIGIQIFVLLLYLFVLPVTFKIPRSVGMMMAGTKFLDMNANEITKLTFLKRECLKWILFPGIFLSLRKSKQSAADSLTKTYVTYY